MHYRFYRRQAGRALRTSLSGVHALAEKNVKPMNSNNLACNRSTYAAALTSLSGVSGGEELCRYWQSLGITSVSVSLTKLKPWLACTADWSRGAGSAQCCSNSCNPSPSKVAW